MDEALKLTLAALAYLTLSVWMLALLIKLIACALQSLNQPATARHEPSTSLIAGQAAPQRLLRERS